MHGGVHVRGGSYSTQWCPIQSQHCPAGVQWTLHFSTIGCLLLHARLLQLGVEVEVGGFKTIKNCHMLKATIHGRCEL